MDEIGRESGPEAEARERRETYRRRDSDSLFVMGIFFTVLSLAVLVGSLWADGTKALVVNLFSGGILLAIGVGSVLYGVSAKWGKGRATEVKENSFQGGKEE